MLLQNFYHRAQCSSINCLTLSHFAKHFISTNIRFMRRHMSILFQKNEKNKFKSRCAYIYMCAPSRAWLVNVFFSFFIPCWATFIVNHNKFTIVCSTLLQCEKFCVDLRVSSAHPAHHSSILTLWFIFNTQWLLIKKIK